MGVQEAIVFSAADDASTTHASTTHASCRRGIEGLLSPINEVETTASEFEHACP